MRQSIEQRCILRTALVFVALALALASSLPAQEQTGARPPNIIVVLVDDAGWSDFSAYGGDVPTPAVDRIASEGVRFTNGYTVCPVCSPSRAGLMTGLYPQRFGVYGNQHRGRPIPQDHPTVAESLLRAGYATGMVGRWDLGDRQQGPLKRGFGVVARRPSPAGRTPTYLGSDDSYITEVQGRRIAEFIRANAAKPFFLYYSPLAFHYPVEDVPRRYLDRVPAGIPESRRSLAGTIIALDDTIGSMLAVLDELRLAHDTLIFLVGDNGGGQNGHDPRPHRGGKATAWNGAVNVPFLMRWPARLPSGVVHRGLVSTLDIHPTCIAAARAAAPARLDGVDVVPWLTGERQGEAHTHLFWDWRDGKTPVRAVRSGRWRLMVTPSPKGEVVRLFDLEADRAEARDAARQQDAVVKELQSALAAWQDQMAPFVPGAPEGSAALPVGEGWSSEQDPGTAGPGAGG